MKGAEPSTAKKKQGGWGRFVSGVQTTLAEQQKARQIAKEARENGKVWDAKTKDWVFYFIDQELEEVEKLIAQSVDNADNPTKPATEERPVADREYYDLLGVSTSADDATIRKAYFKAARKCHPDKNPDDPTAHEKFQQLGHAYQILSKPESRAAYDRDGKPETATAETSMDQVDPFVFFNVMFGSTLIEPYVGELWIASASDSVMKGNDGFQDLDKLPEEERDEVLRDRMMKMQEKSELTQRLRQVKCAQNLRQRIAEFDPEKPEPFVQSAREEATRIVQGPYGALYAITIGFALQMAAEEYLGFEKSFLGLSGHVARSRKNVSSIGSGFKLLGAGIKAATAGSRAMQEAEKLQESTAEGEQVDEKAAQEFMTETIDGSLPAFLELAWAFNKRDIQGTLQEVCRRVFNDASVPKELRLVRAKAVSKLGREFQKAGKAHKKTAKENFQAEDIKARVAVATMTTMAKAQGQEVTEEDKEEMIRQAKQMSVEQESGSAPDTPVEEPFESHTADATANQQPGSKGSQQADAKPTPAVAGDADLD